MNLKIGLVYEKKEVGYFFHYYSHYFPNEFF